MKKITIYNLKTNLYGALLILVLALVVPSCKTKFYEKPAAEAATAGSADFTKYVAVGSTISSGYADNALFTEGQASAYPKLLADRFREVNSALVFNQPDINSVYGWSGTTKGRSLLEIPACTTVSIGGVAQPGESSVLPYTGTKSALTNLSVPFIRIANINTPTVSAGAAANNPDPYFQRIVSGGSLGIASEAKARGASFFTVYIGYVDALRYATSGGTTALVSTSVFQQNIEALLDSLLAVSGSKGVIANIPYVDLFPVVTNNNRRLTSTTDPARNPIRLTTSQADGYNTSLGSNVFNNSGLSAKNYYAITTGTGSIRQLNVTKDFITRGNLLDSVGTGKIDSAAVRNCTPNNNARNGKGLFPAIANGDVLDKDEIVTLRAQIDAYNAIIANTVSVRNASGTRLAVVDLNSFYTKLTDPLYGISYGSTIVRANHPNLGPDFGGFYSLDRVQPTPKGHALLANEFINTINTAFGSTFSTYDPANFRGNTIP